MYFKSQNNKKGLKNVPLAQNVTFFVFSFDFINLFTELQNDRQSAGKKSPWQAGMGGHPGLSLVDEVATLPMM